MQSLSMKNVLQRSTDIDEAAILIKTIGKLKEYEQTALRQLVKALKAAGIWRKCGAVYPFIGSDAFAHQFNLKDPRNLDAAYRCVFYGSPTHDSTGVTTNGTSQYIDTLFALTGAHVEHFQYVYDAALVSEQMPFVGGYIYGQYRTIRAAVNPQYWYRNSNTATAVLNPVGTYSGATLMNRTDATGYRIITPAGATNVVAPFMNNQDIYGTMCIGGRSPLASTGRCVVRCRFAAFGRGYSLTPLQEQQLFTIVQTFQTSLYRQI